MRTVNHREDQFEDKASIGVVKDKRTPNKFDSGFTVVGLYMFLIEVALGCLLN